MTKELLQQARDALKLMRMSWDMHNKDCDESSLALDAELAKLEVNTDAQDDAEERHFSIGEYTISEGVAWHEVRIQRCGGEGGIFSAKKLESAIATFYNEHF